MLNEREWVCSTDFQANYIPEFRSLIAHMKKHEGYAVLSEPCLGKCGKVHTSKGLKRWQLVAKTLYGMPIKISPVFNPSSVCCYSFQVFKIHAHNCKLKDQPEFKKEINNQPTLL